MKDNIYNQVVTLGNRWWGWILVISLGLIVTSCTQRDDDDNSPAAQLQFSDVSFDGAARSLVDDVLLLDGQQLGAFLVDAGGADYDGGGYANLQLSADAVDASIALTPAKDISLTATSGTLYAYYPHSDAVSDITSVPVTSGFTDYLWATPVTGLDNQHTSAAISLHHALAAVRVGVIRGSYTGDGLVESVTLSSGAFVTSGTLNATSGAVIPGSGSQPLVASLSGTLSTTPVTADFAVVPSGDADALTFRVRVDGQDFTVTSDAVTLAAGSSYNYTLTLDEIVKSYVVVDLQSSQGDGDDAISGITPTVSVNGQVFTVTSGQQLEVPSGAAVTVTYPDVAGYLTPATETFTHTGGTIQLTGLYQTELLTVTVGADSGTPTGYTVKVVDAGGNEIGSQTTASATYKVAPGTQYYVTATDVTGYNTPANSSTFTALGGGNRTVDVTYTLKTYTLTVNVSGLSSGFSLTVKYGSTTVTQTATSKTYTLTHGQTWNVNGANYIGDNYTYVFSGKASGTMTANKTVTITYTKHNGVKNPTNGIYIKDTDGYYHTYSKWSSSYTAKCVAVITDNCRFGITLEDTYNLGVCWGGDISCSATSEDSFSEAATDYRGRYNTDCMIEDLSGMECEWVDGAPAAELCVDKGGYLGSAGEWVAVLANYSDINSALNKCGGDKLKTYGNYWTSTQYDNENAWCVYVAIPSNGASNLSTALKHTAISIRAFCLL